MSLYISIDGVDGSGKSTQLVRLAEWLRSRGHNVHTTREPGGTAVGAAIRSILLDTSYQIQPDAELLLFCADRAEHQHHVSGLLAAGQDVVCDRSLASTWAYQVYGRGMDSSLLEAVTAQTVRTLPDITLILDMDVDTALRRSRARLCAEGKTASEGRFEAEREEFFLRVRDGFRWYASQSKHGKCVLIDANGNADAVFASIIENIEPLIPLQGEGVAGNA
jgi:dTMP kinase